MGRYALLGYPVGIARLYSAPTSFSAWVVDKVLNAVLLAKLEARIVGVGLSDAGWLRLPGHEGSGGLGQVGGQCGPSAGVYVVRCPFVFSAPHPCPVRGAARAFFLGGAVATKAGVLQ